MNKRAYVKHPIRMTELAFKVVQARLSLKESQSEFAKRFRVSTTTVYMWERGAVTHTQKIYQEILDSLLKKLEADGRLLPADVIKMIFADTQEMVGDARG